MALFPYLNNCDVNCGIPGISLGRQPTMVDRYLSNVTRARECTCVCLSFHPNSARAVPDPDKINTMYWKPIPYIFLWTRLRGFTSSDNSLIEMLNRHRSLRLPVDWPRLSPSFPGDGSWNKILPRYCSLFIYWAWVRHKLLIMWYNQTSPARLCSLDSLRCRQCPLYPVGAAMRDGPIGSPRIISRRRRRLPTEFPGLSAEQIYIKIVRNRGIVWELLARRLIIRRALNNMGTSFQGMQQRRNEWSSDGTLQNIQAVLMSRSPGFRKNGPKEIALLVFLIYELTPLRINQ